MLLALEPELDAEYHAYVARTGIQFLGIEATRRQGAWPTLRHVYDLGEDAGLHVEITAYATTEAYAVGYDDCGDEKLRAL